MTPVRDARFDTPPGYALVASLRALSMGRFDPTWHLDAGRAAHALITPEGPVTVAMKAQPDSVAVRAWGPGADWVMPRMPRWLGLHDDPGDFDPVHPRLRQAHRHTQGERLPQMPILHDVMWRMVLGQRVTWKNAARSYRALVNAYGQDAPGPLGLRTPPDPQALARLGYEDFHPLGVERSRALLLREVARRHAEVDALMDTSLAHAKASLLAWPGIGPWTVGMMAGTAMGDGDAVPTGDVHLPHTVAFVLQGVERSDDAHMLTLLEPYRPHRWRFLRLVHSLGVHAPRRGPRRPAPWIPDA